MDTYEGMELEVIVITGEDVLVISDGDPCPTDNYNPTMPETYVISGC